MGLIRCEGAQLNGSGTLPRTGQVLPFFRISAALLLEPAATVGHKAWATLRQRTKPAAEFQQNRAMSQFAMLQSHQYSPIPEPLGCPRPGHIETSSLYPRGRNEGLSPPPVSFILFFFLTQTISVFFWFHIQLSRLR